MTYSVRTARRSTTWTVNPCVPRTVSRPLISAFVASRTRSHGSQPPSRIARRGPSTRVPDARPRSELAGARCRPLRRNVAEVAVSTHGPHEDPPPEAETRGPSTRTAPAAGDGPCSAGRAKPSSPTTANSGAGVAENRGEHACEQPTGRRSEGGTRVPVDPVSPADVGSNRGVGAARTARRHGDVGHRWAPSGGEPGTECSARVGSPHDEVPVTTVLGRTTRGATTRQTANRVRQAASRRELATSGCVTDRQRPRRQAAEGCAASRHHPRRRPGLHNFPKKRGARSG